MHRTDGLAKYTGNQNVDSIHGYDIDLEKREIYLIGREEYSYGEPEAGEEEPGVDYLLANRFIKNIRILQSLGDGPILVHMKTCGGNWEEGMAIYDSIKACANHVTILNYTHARSMSSIIFQAADHRVMMPNSYFMMHHGDAEHAGTDKQVRSATAFFNEHADGRKAMTSIYADKMASAHSHEGKTKRQLERFIAKKMNDLEEWYLTAGEAVEHGLADAVFDYDWSKLRYEG